MPCSMGLRPVNILILTFKWTYTPNAAAMNGENFARISEKNGGMDLALNCSFVKNWFSFYDFSFNLVFTKQCLLGIIGLE